MGPIIGLRKLSDPTESSGGVLESRPNGHAQELHTKTGANTGRDGNNALALSNVKEEEASANHLKENDRGKITNNTRDALPSSSNSIEQNSNRHTTEPSTDDSHTNNTNSENLGTVLKGSPFEPTSENSAVQSVLKESTSTTPTSKGPSTAKRQVEAAPNPSPLKVGQSKTNGEPVSGTKSAERKPATARPAEISTKSTISSTTSKNSPGIRVPETTKSPSMAKDSPKTGVTSAKQQPTKEASARQTDGANRNTTTEGSKVPAKKASRQSLATQNAPGALTKTTSSTLSAPKTTPISSKPQSTASAPSHTKKTTSSGSSGFHKPGPKSPTHPVPIRGSATAPTASSAAKNDVVQPSKLAPVNKLKHTPSTIKSVANSSNRGPTTGLRPKSSRPSLNVPPERSTSRASSKSPGEGFLARMMRPTASSASKVHEKVLAETKSPPRKPTLANSKAKSESSNSKDVPEDTPIMESIEHNEDQTRPMKPESEEVLHEDEADTENVVHPDEPSNENVVQPNEASKENAPALEAATD